MSLACDIYVRSSDNIFASKRLMQISWKKPSKGVLHDKTCLNDDGRMFLKLESEQCFFEVTKASTLLAKA